MSAAVYMADMVDAFLPALEEGDRVTILMCLNTYLPWELIEHPSVQYAFAHERPRSAAGRRELNQLVQRVAPDVWWSADTALAPPTKNKRRPLQAIYAIQDFHYLLGTRCKRRFWGWLYRWKARQHLMSADAIVCPNKAIATHTVHVLGIATRRKIAIMPSGIHPIFRMHSKDEILRMRRALLIPQRYVLIVSTTATADYVRPVLEALGSNAEVSSVTCVILGDAGLPSALREPIRDCHLEGMVRFVNSAKVTPAIQAALYSGALVLFEPSQDLAYLPSILRAMACGTPVVCAANAAHEDQFEKAVLRVHPTDAREWRQALTALMLSTTLYDRQVQRGLTFVTQATSTAMAKQAFAFARKRTQIAQSAVRPS